MQKLVWQNANGVELDLTSGNYGITEWEGFSNASLNIQSQQVPFQDGGVFLDALIEQRELSVTLAMQDNNNLELRYQQRRELISALNPKLGEGYLIYTNDYTSKRIKCIPQIPLFENHNSNDTGTPKASLSWTACEPYWEDVEETEVQIVNGITVTQIENTGDVSLGLEIILNEGGSQILIENQQGKKIELNDTNGTFPRLDINTNVGKKSVAGVGINFIQNAYTITTQMQNPSVIMYSTIKVGQNYFTFIINDTQVAFVKSANLTDWEQVGNVQARTDFGFLDLSTVIIYNNTDNKIYLLDNSGNLSISADNGINWTHQNTNYKSMCVNEKTGETFFSEVGTIGENTCVYNSVTQEVMEAYRNTIDEVQGISIRIHRNGTYFEVFHEGIYYDFKSFVNSKGQYIIYGIQADSGESIVLDWNGNKVAEFGNADAWVEREEGYYGVYNIPFASANSAVGFIDKSLQSSAYSIQSFPHHTSSYVIENDLIVFDSDINHCYTTKTSSNNYIAYLSKDSDMTLGLEVGVNNISVKSDTSMTIKYRQKYIGV